jgi:hypothetical protein
MQVRHKKTVPQTDQKQYGGEEQWQNKDRPAHVDKYSLFRAAMKFVSELIH